MLAQMLVLRLFDSLGRQSPLPSMYVADLSVEVTSESSSGGTEAKFTSDYLRLAGEAGPPVADFAVRLHRLCECTRHNRAGTSACVEDGRQSGRYSQ